MSQSAPPWRRGSMSWPQTGENWEGTVGMDKIPFCSLCDHSPLPNRAMRWAELLKAQTKITPTQNFGTESFSHPLELICSAEIGFWLQKFLLPSISLACIPWSAHTISTGITEEEQLSSLTPLRKMDPTSGQAWKTFCIQSQSSVDKVTHLWQTI